MLSVCKREDKDTEKSVLEVERGRGRERETERDRERERELGRESGRESARARERKRQRERMSMERGQPLHKNIQVRRSPQPTASTWTVHPPLRATRTRG